MLEVGVNPGLSDLGFMPALLFAALYGEVREGRMEEVLFEPRPEASVVYRDTNWGLSVRRSNICKVRRPGIKKKKSLSCCLQF
jgi:hypothetical protein